MHINSALSFGDIVVSDFETIGLLREWSHDFDEPHIGVGAVFSHEDIGQSGEVREYWKSLGGSDRALWQPGHGIGSASIIGDIVRVAIEKYRSSGLLPKGEVHRLYGEALSLDGIELPSSDEPYSDTKPHIDFVPPTQPCATVFASNLGGTTFWRGEYGFRGNLVESYEDATTELESHTSTEREIVFSSDARTLLHARDPRVTSSGRVLVRLFLGQG